MSKSAESAAKKDTQKLQRAIVDGLEDVKGHDIKVFDTEALSALFERVIIASGTSNRQTKALAASVRDKVKAEGFAPPRVEGEDNGEWIIVDCGPVVAHIMQPTFRQYYHLEELWGEKPVRLKIGAPKPAVGKPVAGKPAVGKPGSTKQAAGAKPVSLRRSSAAKTANQEAAKSAAAKKAPAKKVPTRKEPAAKSAPAKKTAAKATPAKKAASPKR
jgi:ribosome-associated protein